MAARDVLRNMFGTTQHRAPLTFKPPVELHGIHFEENYSVPEYFLSDAQHLESGTTMTNPLLEAENA